MDKDIGVHWIILFTMVSCLGALLFVLGGDAIKLHEYSQGTLLAVTGMCMFLPGVSCTLSLLIRRDIFGK